MPLTDNSIFSYMVDMVCDMEVNGLDMTEFIMFSPAVFSREIWEKLILKSTATVGKMAKM